MYLLDEHTSLLVTLPAGIATVIEVKYIVKFHLNENFFNSFFFSFCPIQLWKSKKILKLEITWKGIRVKPSVEDKSLAKAEALTKEIDKQGMRYLSYLLYPLCLAGAVYSLIYQPHKRYKLYTKLHVKNIVFLDCHFVSFKLKNLNECVTR